MKLKRYSQEELNYLKELSTQDLTMPNIVAKFNEHFKSNRTYGSIRQCFYEKLNLKVAKQYSAVTNEEKEFLIKLGDGTHSMPEIYQKFIERFGNIRTKKAVIKIFYVDLHLKAYNDYHYYTKEENNFIKNNIQNYRYDGYFHNKEFIEDFNKKFNGDLNETKLECYIKRHKIHFGKQDCKQVAKISNFDKCPIGSECNHAGIIFIKVAMHSENGVVKWIPKHRYLYEKYHNVKLTADDVIIFLDNNKSNYSKDNLYLITRYANIIMASNFHKVEDIELRKTAIKICELQNTLNQIEKGEN